MVKLHFPLHLSMPSNSLASSAAKQSLHLVAFLLLKLCRFPLHCKLVSSLNSARRYGRMWQVPHRISGKVEPQPQTILHVQNANSGGSGRNTILHFGVCQISITSPEICAQQLHQFFLLLAHASTT